MLRVTLPDGGLYFTLPAPPDAGVVGLFICSVDNNASVLISAETGREVNRTAQSAAGDAIIDQIVASATVTAASHLTPPTTGDAGLR